MIKIKNRCILNIWMYLYHWTMSQKLPVNNFEWIKDTSQFNKFFIKTIKTIWKKVIKDIILKWIFNNVKI